MEWLRLLAGLFGPKGAAESTSSDQAVSDPNDAVAPAPKPQEAGPDNVEVLPEAHQIVRLICSEALAARPNSHTAVNLTNSPRYVALRAESPQLQVAVAWAAYRGETDRNSPYYWKSVADGEPRREIFTHALRKNLPFEAGQLQVLLKDWFAHNLTWDRDYSGRVLVGAVERLATRQTLPSEMRLVLQNIGVLAASGRSLDYMSNVEVARLVDRINRLLNPAPASQKRLPTGSLAQELGRWGDTLSPEERAAWLDLVIACAEVGDKSKPAGKWRATVRQLIDGVGTEQLTPYLIDVLDKITDQPSPWKIEDSLDLMKGLVWATTLLDHSVFAAEVGRFAEYVLSNKLTNAAFWALSEMVGEPQAAAELFRLRAEFKQNDTRQLIDRRLSEFAEKSGTTVGALEDFSLPSFGLDEDCKLTAAFGGARAELTVEPTRIAQRWTNSAGKDVKGPPAEVRESFAAELANYRRQAEDIDRARRGQARRLEQAWIEERSWAFSDWEKHFLRHPLRGPLVHSLIWRIEDKSVMPDDFVLKDVSGNPCSFAPDARVQLWHPLHSDPAEVLAWRSRILASGLTQSIKQAYREIYVLTDAERATRTYSNRFAAHILRQHQFTKICQSREWRYKLMGDWDGWNQPTRVLAAQKMTVEYQVETLDGAEQATSGIFLYLASDQVRFLDAQHRAVDLESIPPVVFSEVMRDVDLFVAVTSVANDPNWTDGGPNGRHGGYWQEWAFGELGQTAVMRRELARWLVPKLSIADKLEITDKFLIVQGKRQKYAIHFGSSNIQILPSNRYLCIVPDREPKEAREIKLPFEGDSMFSTILSKAFLLVDESKIKDETILRQL